MLLNNSWVIEEIKRESQKYLETNERKNMTYQNQWDAARIVLRGMFITLQAYLKKQAKSQIIFYT